jgi:hypothetical protein
MEGTEPGAQAQHVVIQKDCELGSQVFRIHLRVLRERITILFVF